MLAWGANYRGQLGDGTRTKRSSPIHVVSEYKAIADGSCDSEEKWVPMCLTERLPCICRLRIRRTCGSGCQLAGVLRITCWYFRQTVVLSGTAGAATVSSGTTHCIHSQYGVRQPTIPTSWDLQHFSLSNVWSLFGLTFG